MNLLLVQNMFYIPTHGGANKANRLLLEGLAARGHTCRAIVPMYGMRGVTSQAEFLQALEARQIPIAARNADAVIFHLQGVEVHAVAQPARLGLYIAQIAPTFAPDWTLVPADDPGLILLSAAQAATPGRVVYLAQTLQYLPFGP